MSDLTNALLRSAGGYSLIFEVKNAFGEGMKSDWYVARGAEQIGPISHAELLALAERGELRAGDQVWRPGLAEWQFAGRVPGLLTPPEPAPTDALALAQEPPPLPEPKSQNAPISPKQLAAAPTLVGVRGWLLWFCICLTVILPIWALADFARSADEMRRYSASMAGFQDYYNLLVGTTLLLVLTGMWVGISVWRQNPGAHVFARHYLLAAFAVTSLVPFTIFVFIDVPPANNTAVVASQVPDILKGALQTMVWYLYLVKSKRVRATFGST